MHVPFIKIIIIFFFYLNLKNSCPDMCPHMRRYVHSCLSPDVTFLVGVSFDQSLIQNYSVKLGEEITIINKSV